mmetsp:Transcript_6679/g.11628  ORF Transcript_6679/g.11628 Transcript_6679/m.11628 type:complete len:488 (+) Transcript_6679:1295-2758(+)
MTTTFGELASSGGGVGSFVRRDAVDLHDDVVFRLVFARRRNAPHELVSGVDVHLLALFLIDEHADARRVDAKVVAAQIDAATLPVRARRVADRRRTVGERRRRARLLVDHHAHLPAATATGRRFALNALVCAAHHVALDHSRFVVALHELHARQHKRRTKVASEHVDFAATRRRARHRRDRRRLVADAHRRATGVERGRRRLFGARAEQQHVELGTGAGRRTLAHDRVGRFDHAVLRATSANGEQNRLADRRRAELFAHGNGELHLTVGRQLARRHISDGALTARNGATRRSEHVGAHTAAHEHNALARLVAVAHHLAVGHNNLRVGAHATVDLERQRVVGVLVLRAKAFAEKVHATVNKLDALDHRLRVAVQQRRIAVHTTHAADAHAHWQLRADAKRQAASAHDLFARHHTARFRHVMCRKRTNEYFDSIQISFDRCAKVFTSDNQRCTVFATTQRSNFWCTKLPSESVARFNNICFSVTSFNNQ